MSGPQWRRYSSEDPEIRKKAVRIIEDSDKTVLVARAKYSGSWCVGEYTVGETHAWVCHHIGTYRLENFEVLIAPEEGYFQWVECWGGYVPKFAVYSELSRYYYDDIAFVGRERGTTCRGGAIFPMKGEFFFPTDSGWNEKYKHYSTISAVWYNALQVAPKYWTSEAALNGFPIQRMDEDEVLSELMQLFKICFHSKDFEFYNSIIKLWIKSGMDTNFFCTKALQLLLDLAQVHGLPSCFHQCLVQLLTTKELKTEEHLREAIKLARFFNYSYSNRGSKLLRVASNEVFPLEEDVKNHFDRLKLNYQGTALQSLFTELIRTLPGSPIRSAQADRIKPETKKKEMLQEERQMERLKRKSLLPPPSENRAPVPHSMMIQRIVQDADLGMQIDLETEEMIKDFSFISQAEKQVFDRLVVDASREAGNDLPVPVTKTLAQSSIHTDQLSSDIFPKLTEYLKNMAEEQFLQNDSIVLSILKLFRDKCRSYSSDTVEVMCKYLESGQNQTVRLYCSQWLQLAVEEIQMHKDQWNSKTFPHAVILTEIIATKPIILTNVGMKPLYFTHSINQPILEILNHFKVKLRKTQWKVTKYIWKLFGKGGKPEDTLSPGWEGALKEGLKYLCHLADAIPKSVFAAVDKVFVEQENCSVLPACAEFICKCEKRRLNSERATMSSQFLEQLCFRLGLSRSHSDRLQYLECLHVLREWQELPDDIFRVYHLEVGAAQLLSFRKGGKVKRLFRNWGMYLPQEKVELVTRDILRWMKNSLEDSNKCYFLSEGMIEAYSSYIATDYVQVDQNLDSNSHENKFSEVAFDLIKAGVTAAATNGQVIPESLLSRVLEEHGKEDFRFPYEFVLARACLKNQSLPEQVLTEVWEYLRKTNEGLRGNGTVESLLVIICTSYLHNRKLPTNPKNFDSSSTIRKQSHREALIFFLFNKFFTKEASEDFSRRHTTDLLIHANEVAQKNTAKTSTRPKKPALATETDENLGEFLKLVILKDISEETFTFRDPESQRRFIPSLTNNPALRKHLREILVDQDWTKGLSRHSIEGPKMLYFARAAFISMVTSSTEEAAQECGEILELICNTFGETNREREHGLVKENWRLKTVVAPLGRMRKLGITSFKCVDNLLRTLKILGHPISAEREEELWENLRPYGFFCPNLDVIGWPTHDAVIRDEHTVNTENAYLGHGDLAEEILLAAQKKYFFRVAEIGVKEIWFEKCADLARFKYKCPTTFLMQCVQEHVIAASQPASWSLKIDKDERKAARQIDRIVYRSVISSLTETIQSKMPVQDNSVGFLKQRKQSVMVLAAELLEALNNDLPKLNCFLSKFSTVNMDALWRILPALYNSELDFYRLNIRDHDYEVEIQAEYIMAKISGEFDKKPRMKSFVALALRSWLRQSCSYSSFPVPFIYDEHCLKRIQAPIRFAVHKICNLFDHEGGFSGCVVHKDIRNSPNRTGGFLDNINLQIHRVSRNTVPRALSLTELFDKLAPVVRSEIAASSEADQFSRIYDVVYGDDRNITVPGATKVRSICLQELTLDDIKQWSDYVRGKVVDPLEAISVAIRAVKVWRSWDLTVVQILAILLGLNQSNKKNRFLELSTGTGKSVVIAVIAAIKALKGNKVDVFTSNHLLARRDAQEWKEFYEFFNLRCSSNGDDAVTYVDGPKECYHWNIDIVYGDIKQFQFDTLRTEFMGLNTRSDRPYDDVIIDEVDSILLDGGSKLAMLSTAFMGMDKLEPIYHIIRSKLIQFDSDQIYYCHNGKLFCKGTGDLKDGPDLETTRREYLKQNLEKIIRFLLGSKPLEKEAGTTIQQLQLPPHLLKFAKSQVSNWAEAVITAEALEENKDYLLVDNKVIPIDPNNGTLQPSSNWTNGLHQFLQIKHQVEFTPESPTTNFLSNWAMSNKYSHRMIGLTGTLGSSESFDLLSKHMSADCISIPDLYPSRFVQFPNILAHTRQDWRDAIMGSTDIETSYGRAVLVICQTMKEARIVYSDLLTEAKFPVKLHVRSDIWMEHHLQQIRPRNVIVTTTLGTRGLDIRASAVEAVGGVHVILAYMPPNTRIVKQAFGRTSRKGNAGSGEFIIKQKSRDFDPAYVMEHIKESEMKSLERYLKYDLPSIISKDETYSGFLARYSLTREEVKKFRLCDEQLSQEQMKHILWKNDEFSGTSRIILEAIQEAWAIHLKKNVEQPSKFIEIADKAGMNTLLNEDWKFPHLLFEKTENCYHATRYGFQLYRKLPSSKDPEPALTRKYVMVFNIADKALGRHKQVAKSAVDYFKLAIRMAPTLSPAAHVGIAYVLLKSKKNLPHIGDHGANHKINALNYLRKATEMLGTEIGYYRGCQSLLSNPSTSPLATQLTERTRALEAYVTVIEETTREVELSLRPIEITYKRVMDETTHILCVADGNSMTAEQLEQDYGIFDTEHEMKLAFHGLKANKDLGYKYQAEDGVKLLYGCLNLPNLKGNQPTVSLWIDGDGIRKVFGVCKEPVFPELSDSDDEEEAEDKPASKTSSFNISSDYKPLITVAFSSIKSWDDVVRTANAFRYKETPKSYIVLRAATNVVEELLASQDDLRESCNVVSKTHISSQTAPSNTSGESVEHETQLTIRTEGLKDAALLFDSLINGRITFDVIFEGVNLEDNEVVHRSRSILQRSTRLTLRFPKLRLAKSMRKMADEITESIRSYCKMFRENGVSPTLEFGNLDSSLAELLYKGVNHVNQPVQQLNLIPLRHLKFATAPSPEALRQIEQQGLLLVAKFAEKNAIPKKAIALVSSVAAGELIFGGTLCGLGLPLPWLLIKIGLLDVWKTYQVIQKREFSLTEFIVEKMLQMAKQASNVAIGNNWMCSHFSSLMCARTPDEAKSIVMKLWDTLTPRDAVKAGKHFAASALFLYLAFFGKKKIVKAIKKQTRKVSTNLKISPVEVKSIQKLWVVFQAVMSTGLNRNPDDELKTWLQELNQVELWDVDIPDGSQVVDWASLQNSVAEQETFGALLLHGMKSVTEQNANTYFKLGCMTITQELKTHCFKLCMDVLLKSGNFEPHEMDLISSQLDPEADCPVTEVTRILGTNIVNSYVKERRLKFARRKFKEIADYKPKGSWSLVQGVLLQIQDHLINRIHSSEWTTQFIQNSVSTTFVEKTSTQKIINLPSFTPENAVPPIQNPSLKNSYWKHGHVRSLMDKISEISLTKDFQSPTFPDSAPDQLASLICYLHEKRIDAVLLRSHNCEEVKAKYDGDFRVPFVIVYKIYRHGRLLKPLKVIREKTETTFTSPDLILKVLSYICGDSVDVIRSFESLQMSTEEGRRIRACLCYFINIVNGRGDL